jgi:ABC-type amino acid transport substrate-binding protein
MRRFSIAVAVALGVLGTLASSGEGRADTLARIKEAGVIKIGYRPDARPHSYVDAGGLPAGYIVDLCREVVAAVRQTIEAPDLKADYITVNAENRFQAVQAGAIDLLCEPSSITIARRELVDFSLPTFIDGAGILTQQGVAIQRFEDFAGKRIGVLTGTTTEQVLRGALADLSLKADVRVVKDHREGAALVSGSKLDAYFADRTILAMLLAGREVPPGLRLGPRYFSYETYGLAMQRGDHAFRLLVDRTLARIYRSGRAEEMIKRAIGADPDDMLRMLIAINALPN